MVRLFIHIWSSISICLVSNIKRSRQTIRPVNDRTVYTWNANKRTQFYLAMIIFHHPSVMYILHTYRQLMVSIDCYNQLMATFIKKTRNKLLIKNNTHIIWRWRYMTACSEFCGYAKSTWCLQERFPRNGSQNLENVLYQHCFNIQSI